MNFHSSCIVLLNKQFKQDKRFAVRGVYRFFYRKFYPGANPPMPSLLLLKIFIVAQVLRDILT